MRGKYSPTVSNAYRQNQQWWENFVAEENCDGVMVKSLYDKEGYDSYGYDKYDTDRAGNSEIDYFFNDPEDYGTPLVEEVNELYEEVSLDWGFDGTKPVLKA